MLAYDWSILLILSSDWSEKIVKYAEPSSPYDALNKFEYLGRPAPLLAKLMKWDQPYEELGPTFSRLLGLSKVLNSEISKHNLELIEKKEALLNQMSVSETNSLSK